MNSEVTRLNPLNVQIISPGTLLLGTYAVERALDAGGMAKTYLTHHRELDNTKHVIKLIKPEFTSSLADVFDLTHSEAGNKSLALLKGEAEALLSIHHDAIVGFQGFQKDAVHGHCLIMEYVEGPSLKDYLKLNTLTIPQFWLLRNRLAGGLAAAHAKGIFHRDISPDNVILPGGKIEEAKLIDFGIAKQHKPNSDGTIFGSVFVGKYAYAAPEQFEGGKIGPYSDLYSLGLVLAEALTGKRLHMGNSEEAARMARRSLPDLGAIPAALRPQFSAMLHPKPSERPQSMLALLDRWPFPAKPKQGPEKITSGWGIGASVLVVATVGFGLLQLTRIDIQINISPQSKTEDLPPTAKPSNIPPPKSTDESKATTNDKPENPSPEQPTLDANTVKPAPNKEPTINIPVPTPKHIAKPVKPKPKTEVQIPKKPPVTPKPAKIKPPIIASLPVAKPKETVIIKKESKKSGSNCGRLRQKELLGGGMGFSQLTQSDRAYLNSECR